MADQSPELMWQGEVPIAARFDDPYFSFANGLEETRHVFLAGNGLPKRYRDGFQIAELGFGTGLNALAALQAWRAAQVPGVLRFTSFEMYPMAAADMARALAVYPELAEFVPVLSEGAADFVLDIVVGDARETVPAWEGEADAWFLDGFSPAKNPELWEPTLMAEVGRKTAVGGTAATYSAAGHVRRALDEAGFEVDRVPGYGRKRHMTVALKP